VSGDSHALRQIRAITTDYFKAMDAGDMAELAEIFGHGRVRAPLGVDGVWVSPEREDAFDWRTQAVETLRETVRMYAEGTPRTCHFTTNLWVQIDADNKHATAVSRFTVLQALQGFQLQPIVIGRYTDTLECTDGRWRLIDRFEDSMIWGDPSCHLTQEALVGVHTRARK
jgi:hypothetical protein